jgi:CRISPR-associated endonuclease/helicase Cas3
MTYFSHSETLSDGTTVGSKLLQEHTAGVLRISLDQLYAKTEFQLSATALRGLLELVVKLHDLGKYTSYFQNYLLKQEPINTTLKQHARIGGYTAYQLLKKQDRKQAALALFVIFLHHSKLTGFDNFSEKINSDAQRVFSEHYKDIEGIIPAIESELAVGDLLTHLQIPGEGEVMCLCDKISGEASVENYFLINYLFSLLIEADKLDASQTSLYARKSISSALVDVRFGSPEAMLSKTSLDSLSTDELRNFCRAEVINQLADPSILDTYIFTLTAPTGIGKTMTALDFALKLKAMTREDTFEPQVIYALPFINIIEQGLREYSKVLTEDGARIVGHYQYADIFGAQDDSDEDGYQQKLMQIDTWQGDFIITSFVQFFETLIGNRNKLLKKFNHLAGSIIILDEVQTLRLDQMPLIGAALFYLAKFLKARIVLMTATKPKIFDLAAKEILNKEGEKVTARELLVSHQQVFARFNRTSLHPLLNELTGEKEEKTQQFVNNVFADKWSDEQSCIIVCNTVKRSVGVFEVVSEYVESNELANPVFYLSTNIVPAHRMERIEQIKVAIEAGKAPILVATQVVEAGVDLEFSMGFRDLGPIDSIIQVAGRVNRNNDLNRLGSPLYILDFGECTSIYGKLTDLQSRQALADKESIPESDYLSLIGKYFDNISERRSFQASRKWFESMKKLKYDSRDAKKDYAVSSFRIIEESNTTQAVFIELGSDEEALRERYLEKITGELSKADFDQNFRQAFQQRIIAIPNYLTGELPYINEYDEHIKLVPRELLDQYYQETTGFIRSQADVIKMF